MLIDKMPPVKIRKSQEINIDFICVSQEIAPTENKQMWMNQTSLGIHNTESRTSYKGIFDFKAFIKQARWWICEDNKFEYF